jgi:HEAT repeat protein
MKAAAIIVMALAMTFSTEKASGQTPTDAKEFVHQMYIEGIPYQEVIRLDPRAVPILLELLSDPREEPYWANIVVALGMLGDERVVAPLIQFIERGVRGRALSREHYAAKSSAVMALGYVVNKSGNRQALTYLPEGIEPDAWRARGLDWRSPWHPNERDRDLHLATMAILGLGLSGNPSAAATLRSLQRPATTEAERTIQAQVADAVAEALKANKEIAAEGLASYYRPTQR